VEFRDQVNEILVSLEERRAMELFNEVGDESKVI
jgi:hypothetical protein